MHSSFIHSLKICKAPLQEIYSEAPQANHSDKNQSWATCRTHYTVM